jgi:hypothetical protein
MDSQELAEAGEVDECCTRIEALQNELDALPPFCPRRSVLADEMAMLNRRIDRLMGVIGVPCASSPPFMDSLPSFSTTARRGKRRAARARA